MSVATNISLADLKAISRWGIIDDAREQELAYRFVERLHIKTVSISTAAGNLSGGNQQKVALARWLAIHPRIMILDEPTQGLDPQTRNHIWHYIQNLSREKGITIFFTTHYLEEAQEYAQRIAIMDHGHIITEGSLDDLLKETGEKTLEDAFLKLTGSEIREESANSADQLRMHGRMRGGR